MKNIYIFLFLAFFSSSVLADYECTSGYSSFIDTTVTGCFQKAIDDYYLNAFGTSTGTFSVLNLRDLNSCMDSGNNCIVYYDMNYQGQPYNVNNTKNVRFVIPPPSPKCTAHPKDELVAMGGTGQVPTSGACSDSCLIDITSGYSFGSPVEFYAEGVSTGNYCDGSIGSAGAPIPDPTCPSGQTNIGLGCMSYSDANKAIDALKNLSGTGKCSFNPALSSSDPACVSTSFSGAPAGTGGTSTADPCIAAGTCTPVKDPCIAAGTCSGSGTGVAGIAGTGAAGTGSAPSGSSGSTDFVGSIDATGLTADIAAYQKSRNDDLRVFSTESVQGYETDKGILRNLFNFQPLGSACTPYTGTVHGISVNIDICKYTDMLRDLIGYLFALFGAWTSFNVVFRPKG